VDEVIRARLAMVATCTAFFWFCTSIDHESAASPYVIGVALILLVNAATAIAILAADIERKAP
jgi:hypothetical protein